MTTDEQKEKLAEALGATRTGTYCQRCGWATDADGERFRTAAAAPFPCVAPCDGSANGFGPHHSSPESDPQALRYELDGCRAEIERLRHEAIIAEQSERLTRRSLESEIEHKAAEIERLRDLGLELLGAGRGLYDYVQAVDAYDPTDGLARWDAVDARCTAPSPVLGESGEGT